MTGRVLVHGGMDQPVWRQSKMSDVREYASAAALTLIRRSLTPNFEGTILGLGLMYVEFRISALAGWCTVYFPVTMSVACMSNMVANGIDTGPNYTMETPVAASHHDRNCHDS